MESSLHDYFLQLTGIRSSNAVQRLCALYDISRCLVIKFVDKWRSYAQYLVDLCQSISSVASRQHLRSANRGLLVVPRHRLSSYGRLAFSVAGPVIWNWLPDSLRDPAISFFKRSLKTFLHIHLLTYLRTYFHTWNMTLKQRHCS